MYDVKYAPFADSYIGMAHGDTYEHVKRWLKQRFTFVDTLFDYAPSYNNDVLTIRANTTELMTLEIETYTPVYQHLSWYNGQMDKKKIDGKVSVEFSGTAQAATDQEVLIYGGSNVKSIKGITSMNPNRMLIGSATKLVELDAHDCPLLADINANKANLSPHEYLNKVNLSNCPLLEGNLRLNNSPLVQEINIKGTKITGMNLPGSIRNLQVLRLPNTITELTLNDASMLHTLNFDEGVNLQSVSMTNCNALENVTGLDLLQTPSITLNNSYNNVAELYFRDTTSLSLSNMSNLERVIFTPNNEYETFELINVANAPNYTISTFNCPKLSTFMTTAPYRESYNNGDYGDIQPNTTFTANSIDISSTQFTDVKLLCTTDTNTLKLPTTVKNFYCDSSFDLDTNYLEDGEYDVVHGELVEQYTTDYEGEVVINQATKKLFKLMQGSCEWNDRTYHTEFIPVVPNTNYSSDMVATGWWCVTFLAKDKVTVIDKYISTTGADIKAGSGVIPNNTYYMVFSCLNSNNPITVNYVTYCTPNLIPSSADGSLIFSMYAPSNVVAPASGTWDLKGLEFDNFHTFGMNNDVKPNEVIESIPNMDNLYCKQGQKQGNNDSNYNEVGWFDLSSFNECTVVTSDGSDIHRRWCVSVSGGAYSDNTVSSGGRVSSLCSLSFLKSVEWFELTCDGAPYRYYISSIQKAYLPSPTTVHIPSLKEVNRYLDSISMPARYDDYNITIKNAYIAPKTHNTMLYPLLVNEDNPITGTLDYTNYAGKHLSWSFAYTDEEYVNIIQPKDEFINTYKYRYNAFYQTEYEFDNPYEIARYTSSASGLLPTFNAEFTYTYDEIDNEDGTYTTKVYADSFDNLPTSIKFDQLYANDLRLLTVDKLQITSAITNMQWMFRNNRALTYVNTDGWDTSNVTVMKEMFTECYALTSLDTSNFDTANVTDMGNMFNECRSLTSLDVSGFDTSNAIYMGSMFQGCKNLTSLDVSGFDTSNVTNMSSMFKYCNSLTSLDISGFATSKVTSMTHMFSGCNNLTSLDVSGLNTSNVTMMSYMFANCSSLTSLDVSRFDTSKVIDISYMFNSCIKLTSIDLSGFDTSKVINMRDIFSNCENLEQLKGNFILNNANCTNMFHQCSKGPDLSEFKMSGTITETNYMFGSFGFGNTPLATSLDLSNIALAEGCQIYQYTFFRCNVADIYPFTNINANCHLSQIALSQEVLLRFINNLVEVTTSPTLTLGATNLAKLTEDQIAIAVNKGWNIS